MARNVMFSSLLVLLLACIQPAMAEPFDNPAQNAVFYGAVCVAATVVGTIVLCVFAQMGPRIFGYKQRDEKWLSPDAEAPAEEEKTQSTQALHPAYS